MIWGFVSTFPSLGASRSCHLCPFLVVRVHHLLFGIVGGRGGGGGDEGGMRIRKRTKLIVALCSGFSALAVATT
jgi:hypothetical protein